MAVNQNPEKRSGRRFNIIDVFVIVLVLLCVLGIYFRGQIAETIGIDKDVEEYTVRFRVEEIRHTSVEYLQAGSEVYFDGGNIHFGTIDGNCAAIPAEIYVDGPDGVPIKVSCPKDTYVDVTGAMKCTGIWKDGGFYLSGTYSLAPGSRVSVRTEMLNFTVIITEISK